MSLYKELSRRNVFRVAIAYLVFSWLLLQIIDLLSDILSLPVWVPKFILLLLGIGFALALIISWAYEITTEGIKKEKEVIRDESITHITAKRLDKITIFALLFGLSFLMVDRFYLQPNSPALQVSNQEAVSTSPQAASANAPAAKAALDKSIAILPFSNRSTKEEDQFFTDGMHDDLLTVISRISDLKVISRTSMMQYRDTTKPLPQIAQELGVSTILEGGIQRAGDRVRINVQLIDAATDQHLWAEIYDHTLTTDNIFTIQSQITDAIAKALKATLLPSEVASIHKPATSSLQAYDLYLLGRQYFHKRTPASLTKAIELFKQAIAIDPSYALAYSGLSDSYSLIFQYGDFDVTLAQKLNLENAQKAVELAPELAESQASLGLSYAINNQPEKAEEHYQKAIELNPNYSMPYVWLASLFTFNNQPKEALDIFLKAYEVDPLHPLIHENLVDMYLTLGETEKAQQQLVKTLTSNPDFLLIYPQLVRLNLEQGLLVEAYKVANRMVKIDSNSPVALANMIMMELTIGSYEGANDRYNQLNQVAPNFVGKPFFEAMIRQSKDSPLELVDYYQQLIQTNPGSARGDWANSQLALHEFRLKRYADAIARIQSIDTFRQNLALRLNNLIIKTLSHKALNQEDQAKQSLEQAFSVLDNTREKGFADPMFIEKEAILTALNGDESQAIILLSSAYEKGLRNFYLFNSWALLDPIFSENQQYLAYKENMKQDVIAQKQKVESLRQNCSNQDEDCALNVLKIGI